MKTTSTTIAVVPLSMLYWFITHSKASLMTNLYVQDEIEILFWIDSWSFLIWMAYGRMRELFYFCSLRMCHCGKCITRCSACTGWPFTLFPTSRWHQNKSSVLVWCANTTFVLVSTRGWEQQEWSPCTSRFLVCETDVSCIAIVASCKNLFETGICLRGKWLYIPINLISSQNFILGTTRARKLPFMTSTLNGEMRMK